MGNLEFKDYLVYKVTTKDNTYSSINNYSDGYAAAQHKNGVFSYIDKTGKDTVLFDYRKVYDFHEGFARVKKQDGYYAFINKDFDEVFSCDYYYVGDFYNGFALVRNANGLFGYIDKTGKEIIPCIYKSATDFIYKDSLTNEVYAQVFCFKYGNVYIDKKGNCVDVINLEKEGNNQKLIPYKETNKLCGYKNKEGEIVVSARFIEVNEFNEGFAVVRDKNKNLLIIDENGNKQQNYSIIDIYSKDEQSAIMEVKKLDYKIDNIVFDSYFSELKINDNNISISAKTETELRTKKIIALNEIKTNIENAILSISKNKPNTKKII